MPISKNKKETWKSEGSEKPLVSVWGGGVRFLGDIRTSLALVREV